MAVFRESSNLPHSAEEVYQWHSPGPSRLAPPWRTIELQRHDGIDDGDRIVFRLKNGPFALTWDGVARPRPGRQFVDVRAGTLCCVASRASVRRRRAGRVHPRR